MSDNYFKSEEFKELLTKYEESEKTGEPVFLDADEYADLAEYYFNEGNDALKGIDLADEGIRVYPGATLPLVFRARFHLMFGETNEARDTVNKIEDKSDPDYYYIVAEIMIVEGRIDESDLYLEQQMELFDENDLQNYILDVANLYVDYNEGTMAHKWLMRYDDSDPTDDYKELLARTLLVNGEFEKSEQIFNDLIDHDPYSTTFWNYLATAQMGTEKASEAISSCEYALAIDPNDDQALLTKAHALHLQGNDEESLVCYRKYSERRLNSDAGELGQGIALACLNRLDEAEQHLKKGIKKTQPRSANAQDIYHELIYVLSQQGKYEEAFEYIDEAVGMGLENCELTVLRGHLYLQQGKLEKAVENFGIAVNDKEATPLTLLQISVSTYENGYMDFAYKMFATLFEAADDNWRQGYAYMAACCKEMGKDDEYLEYLRKACEVNPNEAKAVFCDLFPQTLQPSEYYEYAKNRTTL